jgi:HNH endonuclease
MRGSIISYIEMCKSEGVSLQKGMNFRLKKGYSVVLMSVRKNSPYKDQVSDDGKVLIYEGHDVPKTSTELNPKEIDQPAYRKGGSLTDNGKFQKAVKEYHSGSKRVEKVRVYEKIKKGIWSDNGFFHLIDCYMEDDGNRNVFKFKLEAIDGDGEGALKKNEFTKIDERTRLIPTNIKIEVWKRDGGKCTQCGASDELHFDHIVPYSKGGTSLKVENIQLLCARHNLSKSDKIL